MTQFEALSNAKVRKQIASYINELATSGYTYTGYYTGSGRHTKAQNYKGEVESVLRSLGISYAAGNDAPRGGVSGEYVVITSKAVMANIRKSKEYRTLVAGASRSWAKPKKHTKAMLINAIEEKLNGEKFKYGYGVCRLIVKDEQIMGVLEGGFHNSKPSFPGYTEVTNEEWQAVILDYAKEQWGDVEFIKADYSDGEYELREIGKHVNGAKVSLLREMKYADSHDELDELNIDNVHELVGKHIQTLYYGYDGQDGVDDFVVGEIVSEYEIASRETLDDGRTRAQYWESYMSENQLRREKETLQILTADGRETYIRHNPSENYDGEFYCSDTDRTVYFRIID